MNDEKLIELNKTIYKYFKLKEIIKLIKLDDTHVNSIEMFSNNETDSCCFMDNSIVDLTFLKSSILEKLEKELKETTKLLKEINDYKCHNQ